LLASRRIPSTSLSRTTAGRKPATPLRATRVVPANRLSPVERKRVVTTLDSARFVDQPLLQVYAQLLDEDTYLCSVYSMYRILGGHRQVRERRRLARHPARVRPELVATVPGQVCSWDITKLAGPVKGRISAKATGLCVDRLSREIAKWWESLARA